MNRYKNSRLALTPESTLFIWVSLGANNDRAMYSRLPHEKHVDVNRMNLRLPNRMIFSSRAVKLSKNITYHTVLKFIFFMKDAP